MVDKVTGNRGFEPLGNANRAGKNVKAKNDANLKSDRVDFSSALKNASDVQESSAAQKSARAEKIQALKAQIDNGTYQPDLGKVASSLLPFIVKDS